MSEIEKMYEKLNIEKKYSCDTVCYGDLNACPLWCKDCKHIRSCYPPFTAEKVLEVIVFFLNKGVRLDFSVEKNTKISVDNFKECVAQIGAKYWQDLTEEEQQQVKGILE